MGKIVNRWKREHIWKAKLTVQMDPRNLSSVENRDRSLVGVNGNSCTGE